MVEHIQAFYLAAQFSDALFLCHLLKKYFGIDYEIIQDGVKLSNGMKIETKVKIYGHKVYFFPEAVGVSLKLFPYYKSSKKIEMDLIHIDDFYQILIHKKEYEKAKIELTDDKIILTMEEATSPSHPSQNQR